MSKPVLLSGGNGKVSELAGTANGQFLVNNGSNEVVFSSATAPTSGQVPVWSGSAWAPGTISPGGGGGGGLTYLLNYSVAGASPTPSGTWKQLSLTPTASAYNTGGGAVTAPNGGTYADLANFVTPLTEPGATTTPPGFWDLNVYLTSSGAADETLFRFSVHKWDGTTLSAAIATSANVGITNPAVIALYTASVFVPSTVLSATERIAIKVEVTRTTSNAHTVTGYFEGVYYTHMHTTLGAPGSTGLVKVVNGIIQAPATLLVNADVSDTAAVAVAKLSAGTNSYVLTTVAGVPTWSAPAATGVTSLTGTADQVIASASTGAVTLSLPQSIGTGSSVSFGGVTVSGTGNITVAGTGYLYLTNQTASLPLVVQAGKNVIAQAINLASVQVTGTLDVPNGGTGATTLTGYVKGSGASALTASATIPVADLNGQVALAKGGTAANLTAVNGGAVYSTASALAITAAGTSGQFLKSNGAAAPTWADVTVSSQPYDISGEVVGTPTTGATVLRFVAIRAFTLSSATSARFACTTGPTSTATFTINHVTGGVTTSKGTVTIATSATSGSGTLTSTSVAAGDYITVVATTPAAITDVWFTLPGTV